MEESASPSSSTITIEPFPKGLPIGRPQTAFYPWLSRVQGVLPTWASLAQANDRNLPRPFPETSCRIKFRIVQSCISRDYLQKGML